MNLVKFIGLLKEFNEKYGDLNGLVDTRYNCYDVEEEDLVCDEKLMELLIGGRED